VRIWCFKLLLISNVVYQHGLPDRGPRPEIIVIAVTSLVFILFVIAVVLVYVYHQGEFHDQADAE
jgi:hypothetical protein